MLSLCIYLTVAILAQGTHWAVAPAQAYFISGPQCLYPAGCQLRVRRALAHRSVIMHSPLTAVGFEPTPLRNGALSHRLRPLGQTVLIADFEHGLASFELDELRY